MPSTREIAEVLWARCLEADHKPGRVQFTKYLYLIDYTHWRFHGRQLTDAKWIFHHYGPWAAEVDMAMNDLAGQYGFGWDEEEDTVVRFVRVDEPPASLGPGIEAIIQRILGVFKDRDLTAILNFTYGQTEPMLVARRGEVLDFSTVPIDKSMPIFCPPKAPPADATLHPRMSERVAAFRAVAENRRAAAEQRAAYRESADYEGAMQLLADDLGAGWKLPEFRARVSEESVKSLGEE